MRHLPNIEFGPEADAFSLVSVLTLLNEGHRAEDEGNGDVYLEFHLTDGSVIGGTAAGLVNDENILLIEMWDRRSRTPLPAMARVAVAEIERIVYV